MVFKNKGTHLDWTTPEVETERLHQNPQSIHTAGLYQDQDPKPEHGANRRF